MLPCTTKAWGRKWRTEGRVLKTKLDNRGIRCQGQPERRWLAELLRNKRAVGTLLVYLKDTGVGSREKGDRERRWSGGKEVTREGVEKVGNLCVAPKKGLVKGRRR